MWDRKYLERNRGLQPDVFSDAMKKAGLSKAVVIRNDESGMPKTPGTDIIDPYASIVKPKGVPTWDHCPVDDKEEAIYYGKHIHSESNPLGLHSHVIGGKLSGGHSHGPQNRAGAHHHKKDAMSVLIDGAHVHDVGRNHPDGWHEHMPENFG